MAKPEIMVNPGLETILPIISKTPKAMVIAANINGSVDIAHVEIILLYKL